MLIENKNDTEVDSSVIKLFMDYIKFTIDCEYTFASVIIKMDRANDKFDIICQVNPKFFIVLDKANILALSRNLPFSIFTDIDSVSQSQPNINPIEWFDNGGHSNLTQAIKDCVDNLWLNLIRSKPQFR